MASFLVEGGHQLHGEITPQGAKNEALQVICATLLTTDEVVIDNVPDILDVNNLIHLLIDMGVKVTRLDAHSYSFKAEHIDTAFIESQEFIDQCTRLRGSVMIIAPLLSRLGKVCYAHAGGDKIGRRRLDTHFRGLSQLGATFAYDPVLKLTGFKPRRGSPEVTCCSMRHRSPEQPTS